jgi:tetratricopeptide (TPR) repeat protein
MKLFMYKAIGLRAFCLMVSVLTPILFVPTMKTIACVNPVGQEMVGVPIYIDNLSAPAFQKALVTHEDQTYWKETLAELQRTFMENRINIAVAMIHLGRVKDAIRILEKFEREDPGSYYTAANLGTAYELSGENKKALKWITEGVKRAEGSHYGTEWLHIKILEAKLAIEKDAGWLEDHSVLGIDFDGVSSSQRTKVLLADHRGKGKTLSDIEYALVYQLHERLEFVKPPEPVVADLLSDLTRVLSSTRTPEHAAVIRDLAVTYGADKEKIKQETKPEKVWTGYDNPYRKYMIYGGVGLVGVLIALVGFYIFRRRQLV